jgi:hypothetical protein
MSIIIIALRTKAYRKPEEEEEANHFFGTLWRQACFWGRRVCQCMPVVYCLNRFHGFEQLHINAVLKGLLDTAATAAIIIKSSSVAR